MEGVEKVERGVLSAVFSGEFGAALEAVEGFDVVFFL